MTPLAREACAIAPTAAQAFTDAVIAASLGHHEQARALAQSAVGKAGRADVQVAVRANVLLARLDVRASDLVAATDRVIAAYAAAAKAPAAERPWLIAVSRIASGLVLSSLGDHDSALTELDRALPLVESSSEPTDVFYALFTYGVVLSAAGRPQQAMAWFQNARDQADRLTRPDLLAQAAVHGVAVWHRIGALETSHAADDAARRAWQTGVAAAQSLISELDRLPGNYPEHTALAVRDRSLCLAELGRDDEAFTGLSAVQDVAGDVLAAPERLRLSVHRAAILLRQGQNERAWTEVSRAVEAAADSLSQGVLVDLYEMGARVAEERGQVVEALSWYRKYHVGYRKLNQELLAARERLLAVRHSTRRALAQVEQERRRAADLDEANRRLADRAARLEHDASRDPLTGLANRRLLESRLAIIHGMAQAQSTPLCVAMIDIDHFKAVNDNHTHAVGDIVLRAFATLLTNACRSEDLIARFGGEEFIAVFDNVVALDAVGICERMRRAIELYDWNRIAPGLVVSASFGLAQIAGDESAEQAILRADRLLYLAKSTGRNRVVAESVAGQVPLPDAAKTSLLPPSVHVSARLPVPRAPEPATEVITSSEIPG